jgi:hypothetical protein
MLVTKTVLGGKAYELGFDPAILVPILVVTVRSPSCPKIVESATVGAAPSSAEIVAVEIVLVMVSVVVA